MRSATGMSVCILGVRGALRSAVTQFGPLHRPGVGQRIHGRFISLGPALLKARTPKILPEDEKFIVKSPYSDVELPEVNLADYVWKDVDKWPDNVALVSKFQL